MQIYGNGLILKETCKIVQIGIMNGKDMLGKRYNYKKGKAGEEIACNFLLENSYVILEKNFRVGKLGELDIIARDNDCICFIEVKARKNVMYGFPSESVNLRKQSRMKILAQIFLQRSGFFKSNTRFDVIEIFFGNNSESVSINVIRNAF